MPVPFANTAVPPPIHPRSGRQSSPTTTPKKAHPFRRNSLRLLFAPFLNYRRSKRTRALVTLVLIAVIFLVALFLVFGVATPFVFSSLFSKSSTSNSSKSLHNQPNIIESPNSHNFTNRPKETISVNNISPIRADVSALQIERLKYDSHSMSLVVLFHNEYDSLEHSLSSWIKNGLIDYVQQVVFFLNGVPSQSQFLHRIKQYDQIPKEKRHIHISQTNLPLGLAITKMIEMATSEYILLLEKDWELIEPQNIMRSRLLDSKVIVGSGIAHLVRHRHRHNPGVPLHALIMHQGREESILRQQPNLLCFVHHWQPDPPSVYPGQGIMYRCGGAAKNVEEEDIFCSSSVYCQWNNNPGVFKRKWFMDEVGKEFRKQYAAEFALHGSTSPFLDFEYYTNWRRYAWTDKNFTVAVGTGLFSHAETEHKYFNTFWYAYYRLQTDFEETRNQYLANETIFKKLGGVHFNTKPPKPMMKRYPVDFVRKFHFPDMFTGNLDTQRKMIDDYYQEYLKDNRILSEDEWKRTGPSSKKARQQVSWRVHITKLHDIVEKARMIAPPALPHEINITLVSCLLDIGRNELANDRYQFGRDFKIYLDAMSDWLTHKYPKVVYTTKKISEELLKSMSDESKQSTRFVHITKEELRTKWLGPDNYAKVQEIRKSAQWRENPQATWLNGSPQAALQDYNPLVMSKMFIMREAARENYWKTSHFVFLDSKHNCRRPKVMTPKNDHILRAHMVGKLLLTTFDYTPLSEVHGFEYKAFNKYCNKANFQDAQLLRIGRGGIFGGSAFVLEFIAAMYDVALTATLREGLMGTEENILSILKYQVSQYIDEFSNNWACKDQIKKDHYCKNMADHQGYNCAIFDWISRDAVSTDDSKAADTPSNTSLYSI